MNQLPQLSFLQSRAARIELARERFFDEGKAPTGLVNEAVFESWSRCVRVHGNPRTPASFQPVTASRTQLALLKNLQLRQAWLAELPALETILGTTSCAAMLTDATGILIGATCVGRAHEALMPVATRLGVNLSEAAVGTTAPGVVARTGKAVCVMGGEHFFDSLQAMYCAAAPIRDIHGRLAGVLDLSSERMAFEFDAAAVVGLYAGAIENRLLVAQSTEHLVVRFQLTPELLDSAMVGLVGVAVDGQQAWGNSVAQSLLGAPGRVATGTGAGAGAGTGTGQTPLETLGVAWSRLAALPATGAAPLTLPNGLRVWARADMRSRDGHRGLVSFAGPAPTQHQAALAPTLNAAPAAPAAPWTGTPVDGTAAARASPVLPAQNQTPAATTRLRESGLDLIQKTLHACGGNVSDAAQRLGVSRGLIYRRLRTASPSDRPSDHPLDRPSGSTPSD